MSKIEVSFADKEKVDVRGKYDGVPIFYRLRDDNNIYSLIKDAEDKENPFSILCVTNGHIQYGCRFKSIEEFLSYEKNAIFLNLFVKGIEI